MKGLRAQTHVTLIGLLAATGPRPGEALALDGRDADLSKGILSIRESKFGKSRFVPLRETGTSRPYRNFSNWPANAAPLGRGEARHERVKPANLAPGLLHGAPAYATRREFAHGRHLSRHLPPVTAFCWRTPQAGAFQNACGRTRPFFRRCFPAAAGSQPGQLRPHATSVWPRRAPSSGTRRSTNRHMRCSVNASWRCPPSATNVAR